MLGLLLFLGGLATVGTAILRWVPHLSPEPQAVAASALAGAFAFLVMCLFGESHRAAGKGHILGTPWPCRLNARHDAEARRTIASADPGHRRVTHGQRLRAWFGALPAGLLAFGLATLALVAGSAALTLGRRRSTEPPSKYLPWRRQATSRQIAFVRPPPDARSDAAGRRRIRRHLSARSASISKKVTLVSTPRSVLLTVSADTPDRAVALVTQSRSHSTTRAAGRCRPPRRAAPGRAGAPGVGGLGAGVQGAPIARRETEEAHRNGSVRRRRGASPRTTSSDTPRRSHSRRVSRPASATTRVLMTALAGALLALVACIGSLIYSRRSARPAPAEATAPAQHFREGLGALILAEDAKRPFAPALDERPAQLVVPPET